MKRIVNFSFGLYTAFVFAMAGNAIASDCPLCTAVERGDILAVNRLIANSPNLNVSHDLNLPHGEFGRTVLMTAAHGGHFAIVKTLLSAGAILEATDKSGDTALMKAVGAGHAEIVKVLLSAGANSKAIDKNGVNSLMLASGAQIVDLQKLISSTSSDKFYFEINRELKEVVERLLAEQVNTMKVLLEAASSEDINALDNTGWTALMYAAKIGSANATRLLINHDADVNLANADGWTALDIAEEIGDRGVARILRNAGAEQ